MEKVIRTQNQQEFTIEIPPPSNIQSFFAFALHKSGSVLLDSILQDICACLNISIFGFENALFEQGYGDGFIALSREEIEEIFARNGYCFHGFRALPSYLESFDFSDLKKILLIRDPRDILVSYYFSMRASHEMTTGEAGKHLLDQRQQANEIDIDDYVIQNAPFFREVFEKYEKIEGSFCKLFRYEDVIFNKYQWICEILEFLNLKLDEQQIIEIANKYDVFPTKENSSLHIRRVTPGDHTRKLNPDTIKTLNIYFEDILIKYGYDFDGRAVERQALELHFHQSRQRIQVLENQLHQSRLKTERSQNELDKTQVKLEKTQAQLQTVQLKLEQTQVQLQKNQLELEQTQAQLQTVQLQLERSRSHVKRLQAKTQRLRRRTLNLTTELQSSHVELSSIKASRFWCLWSIQSKLNYWLKLKWLKLK